MCGHERIDACSGVCLLCYKCRSVTTSAGKPIANHCAATPVYIFQEAARGAFKMDALGRRKISEKPYAGSTTG
jgi:hypothetical protein